MDKNTYTGFFLIVLIVIGSYFLLKPSDADIKKEKLLQDSLKRVAAATATFPANTIKTDTTKKVPVTDSMILKAPFGAASMGTEKFVTIENQELRVKLSTKGGRIYSVELKNYKTFNKKPLILFDGDKNAFGLTFRAQDKPINTNDLYFTSTSGGFTVAEKDSSSLTMRLTYSPTQYIDYIYSLKGTGFKLGLTVKTTGLDNVIANSNTLNLNWSASLHKQEMDMKQERQYTEIYYKNVDDEISDFGDTKDEEKTVADKKLDWVAFKDHFFSNILIAKQGGIDKSTMAVNTDVNSTTDVKQMKASFAFTRSTDGNVPLEFYFGPNQFSILKAQGNDLDKVIGLGWGPLKYINRYATVPLFNLLKKFNWNYGLVILALTLILKLVLSPLTYKSYLSMAKMRILKPEMDEIKAKVGEDNPTLLQQEYMKLYKKAGVNPLGGCLPLLLQMPIVIAFFRFFPSLFELRGQSFLWMHDLSTYDSVITFSPIFGTSHLSLMCLLMTISTLVYTYFNNQISGATGQMKYIGYITPIIFLVTLNNYPAGLNYYYFLANMMTFAQQYLIRLMVDDKKIHAQIQENKKKPEEKKKKSGFQARMEEMMRQQQQAQGKKK
ncbi:membrane protein insertase YidC [Mucilaginibacter ginsenosidivorans]|uniref:Membrane protein insertase YidC n=1 Tax=Mucilaginibacter ginsenosidivorans TaxID=398053 RepID=A0A5B8V0F7_9SPHI|nr:membrane protein insertase YidC [Mucilaginibacter ginsenosidivorans]QEC64834.1 membrane protein insertase YidC [Mucilaginibacter ginsenosidivorans]